MKTCTIIAGVNGTGKSSLTGVLRRERRDMGVIIDVDQIAAAHGGNDILAGRLAIQTIRNCLAKGIDFTQETTLSGTLSARTLQQAKQKGYYIRMYYVGLDSAEESLDRIANRVKRGGHPIPSADVLRRFATRAKSLAAVLPYCNEVAFLDNSNGFVAVAEYRNGTILCFENAPAWMKELAAVSAIG